MRYPHEDDKVLRARGVALWSLSCLYVFSFGLKVSLDYLVDHAFLFHYIARTASGNKVLYTKSVLHLVGFLISVLTIFNSVYNCFSKDPWTTYVVSITSGGLSFIYAVIQGYKSDKKHGLVETKGEERQGRMLKSCTDIPPRGRLVLHEIDEDAENFEVAPREGSQVPN
ncbi:hypothetical protein POM88_018757 [Heracleum sosnowskyi]|uniref:Uncharacterized protein n=1 Tax=Heracleum sosnowskyi TaxID=360622 RepID=A0AAD8IR41_9APIA|nr:hypothetical protein POM88_018757 [Heracleum sosnowskyi]